MWRKHFAAIFLDMDGALLDSDDHAEQVWEQWAHQRQIDHALLRPRIYSQRVQETLRQLAPATAMMRSVSVWSRRCWPRCVSGAAVCARTPPRGWRCWVKRPGAS
ncbi:hypothetical protein N4G58_16985 [Edwardsiella piscicida]|nr:hypothetical protein N4G58_16985 [Edwardsiella piscicida]